MKEQSTRKGFAILSIATIIVKLLSLIYSPFIFKILGGNRALGIYSCTYQIYTFIYVLTNVGIPSAISKLVSEYIAIDDYSSAMKVFKISRLMLFFVGIIMASTMFFMSNCITSVMKYPEARYSVIALSPAILFTSVASAYRGYFQGIGDMKPTAISQVLEQILNTVFSLLFAGILIGFGIEYGCIGGTIGTTIGALVSALYLKKAYEKNKKAKSINFKNIISNMTRTNKRIFKRIIKYSIPITLCIGIPSFGSLIDMYVMTDRLIAGGFSHDNAQSLLGLYTKFTILTAVPITIISALSVTILPAVSKAISLNNRKLAECKINLALKLSFLISIPAAIGLTVLSKPIYSFLKYNDGYDIMMIGAGIVIFMSLFQIQISVMQALGKVYMVMIYCILGIIIKYIINYRLIVIPSINIYGVLIGSLAGFLLPVILNFIYIKVYLKIEIKILSYIFKTIKSSIVMGLTSYLVFIFSKFLVSKLCNAYITNAISVCFAIAIGIITYSYLIIFSNAISEEEINLLPRKVKNFISKKIIILND